MSTSDPTQTIQTTEPSETLQTLATQMQQLRDTIAQQRAHITALREEMATLRRGQEEAAESSSRRPPQPARRVAHTSRRKLLQLGGAAAAATAAAAVVALGHGEVAHAATGNNLVLGQTNDAGATTWLVASAFTSPNPLLLVDNSVANGLVAVEGEVAGSQSIGIGGYTDFGTGVLGSASGGLGVHGISIGNNGVYGESTDNSGVAGKSTNGVGGWFSGGRAQIQLEPASTGGAPTAGQHFGGDLFMDNMGTLWVCVLDGVPGGWMRLAGVASGSGGGAITYLTKPIRLLDTRSGATDALNTPGSPDTVAGSPYALRVAGVSYNTVTVPAGALGAIGNVTVVNPAGGGYLALVPHGAGFSGTAILAFSTGQVVSNSFNVGLAGGDLDIIIGGSTTDVILDLFAVVA